MSLSFYAPEIRRLGAKLMHHQCWFFGRDIWHPDGNLLIRYGFERFGVSPGEKGGNAYRLEIGDSRQLVVWGFGVFFGAAERGGIFIKRYDFEPLLLKKARFEKPVFHCDKLPFHCAPRTEKEFSKSVSLAAELIAQIQLYEKWIDRTCGKAWREECLREWQNAELSISRIRRGWRQLHKTTGEI